MFHPLPALLAVALSATPVPPVLNELPQPHGVYELRHDWWVDGGVTVATGAAWILSEAVLKRQLAPTECRWCERAADGTNLLNGMDTWGLGARWENPRTAATLSDLTGEVAVPLAMLGGEAYLAATNHAASNLPVDYLIILESATVAALLDQVVKFSVGRERPFVHRQLQAGQTPVADPDNDVSFYSGHTNMAFVLTVAAGTVAELRGYEGRWLIWAVGLPLSAATAYLRMAADKHYLSDVLTGAVAGGAIGFLVPAVFHGRAGWKATDKSGAEATLSVAPGGVAVVGRF